MDVRAGPKFETGSDEYRHLRRVAARGGHSRNVSAVVDAAGHAVMASAIIMVADGRGAAA